MDLKSQNRVIDIRIIKMFLHLSTENTQEAKKRAPYLLLLPHISSASVMAFSKKMTDDLYSYVCFLPEKNSLLRIGKHKRCSLSIYHTSFDPHQLHYSKATIEEERNIPRPYN